MGSADSRTRWSASPPPTPSWAATSTGRSAPAPSASTATANGTAKTPSVCLYAPQRHFDDGLGAGQGLADEVADLAVGSVGALARRNTQGVDAGVPRQVQRAR